MKFSVKINDSARHVVSAKGIVGAVKAAMDSLDASDELPAGFDAPLTIELTPILPKAKKKPEAA